MTIARIAILFLFLTMVMGCGRKGDESLPERKGNLKVLVSISDETSQLGSSIPIRVTLYDDTLHQYQIDTKRITTEPEVVDSVEFDGINARSAFYYIEVKLDFHNSLDATCGDTPVYVQDGVTRRVGVDMLYRFTGMTCTQF